MKRFLVPSACVAVLVACLALVTIPALSYVNPNGTEVLFTVPAGQTNITPTLIVSKTTSVTPSPVATAADQNLMVFSVATASMGNYFSAANRLLRFSGAGTYTTGASGQGTMTFRLKACTVSGCATGNTVTLATWGPTAAANASVTSFPWAIESSVLVVTTGATGTLITTGSLDVTLGATSTAATVRHLVPTTGPSAAVDLTAGIFFQFTVSAAGASTNNAFTQLTGTALSP